MDEHEGLKRQKELEEQQAAKAQAKGPGIMAGAIAGLGSGRPNSLEDAARVFHVAMAEMSAASLVMRYTWKDGRKFTVRCKLEDAEP